MSQRPLIFKRPHFEAYEAVYRMRTRQVRYLPEFVGRLFSLATYSTYH